MFIICVKGFSKQVTSKLALCVLVEVIDRNDVAPQFELPSASNNAMKLEWPVAPQRCSSGP